MKQDPKKGEQRKKSRENQKGNKHGTHPFVDPELRTRSEIETQSMSPKANEESGCGRTRNGTKEVRPKKITIYLENTTQTVSKARSRN